MPAFPRYRFNIDNEYFLTHSLDRMSVLLTAACVKTYLADSRFQSQMKLSGLRGKDFEAMARVDKQLEAMIDHAIGYLNGYEHNVDGKKVFLFGFSASGNFANRWALLYPDRVKGVIAGGTNSQPTIPAKEVDGEKLIFPIGVYDYKGITGKEFSKEAYGKVANFIFQGERDEADTYGMPDTFGPEENRLIKVVLGEKMYPNRWERSKSLFFAHGGSANFMVYKGMGHNWDDNVVTDMARFVDANRDSAAPVYPEPANKSIVISDTGKGS